MSRTPCASSFFGIGSWPHSGMPGAPSGPAFCSTSTESFVDRQRGIVDARRHVVVVGEHDGGPGVPQQVRLRRRRLDHRAVGREVAAQHGEAVAARPAPCRAAGSRRALNTSAPAMFSPSVLPLTVRAASVEQVADVAQQCAQSAGVEEVLHQELARRPDVGDERRLARERVEAVDRRAGCRRAARSRPCARRHWSSRRARAPSVTALSMLAAVRKSRGFRSSHTMSTMRRPVSRRHARVARVGGGNRRRAGQREAHRLGGGGHRRRRAHRHAVAGRARDAVLDLAPLLVGDVAGALLRPVFPDVGAAAELLVAPVAATASVPRA